MIHKCEILFVASFLSHGRTLLMIFVGICKWYLRLESVTFPFLLAAIHHADAAHAMIGTSGTESPVSSLLYFKKNPMKRYWLTQFYRQCTSPSCHRWILVTDTFGQIPLRMYRFVRSSNTPALDDIVSPLLVLFSSMLLIHPL